MCRWFSVFCETGFLFCISLLVTKWPRYNGAMNMFASPAAKRGPSVAAVTAAGLAALAVAMGVGRFAFTPILPMMQTDAGLTLRAAGWLAASNYLGYLVGALCAAWLRQMWAIRGGLVIIAIVTCAMGVTASFAAWLVLRLMAGVASAWVLIHISAWALERLSGLQRSSRSGVVYAGVGVGVMGAGLLCIPLMLADISSRTAWKLLGLLSAVLAALVWQAFADGKRNRDDEATHQRFSWNRDYVRLTLCYAAFGFGYIIPATYLPAMAHRYITNPVAFGMAWPVFGAAAALSTWGSARWLGAISNRKLWAGAYVCMAIGVVLPVIWPGLVAILVAALLVGGTFMVATMVGLREARIVAPGATTALIAVLTAAFALMQVVGPIVVSVVAPLRHGLQGALLAATALLAFAAWSLWHSAGGHDAKTGVVK